MIIINIYRTQTELISTRPFSRAFANKIQLLKATPPGSKDTPTAAVQCVLRRVQ
jgi:hypothetical protein